MKHTKNLFNYIDSLIRENKISKPEGYYLHVDDLHESDKENFAAHLIEFNSFNHEGWDFLFEDAFREELAGTFSDYILSYGDKKEEIQDAFLNALKKSAIKVYHEKMQSLIDERIDEVYREDMYESFSCEQDYLDYQEART